MDDELAAIPTKRLAALTAGLSERYRAGRAGTRAAVEPSAGRPRTEAARLLRSPDDALAYAAFRLPATFAAVHAALSQVAERLPDWRPETLLDVGAGPGTATWAAAAVWPSLRRATLVDRDRGMMTVGKRLAERSSLDLVRGAEWREADLSGPWQVPPSDLVIAAYTLGELPEDQIVALAAKLWEATVGTLLLLEPGTPEGFWRIRGMRERLLAAGAHMAAPCPHDGPCPNDWCHFAQRVSRSRLHRQVKAGELSYEDEKFAFAAVTRMPVASIPGRVIRHPRVGSGHVRFELCTPDGLTTAVVTRKNRDLWRQARDLRWGSVMGAPKAGGEPGAEPESV